MKKLMIVVLMTLVSASAYATVGFLQEQWTEGRYRHCVYDVLGDSYEITIPVTDICPITIDV